MNSEVPSSENELPKDGSSGNDPNGNSVDSPVTSSSSDQVELSDHSSAESQAKGDQTDISSDQVPNKPEIDTKISDTESRLQQLEKSTKL